MPSYDNKVLTGDQLVYYSGLVKTALAGKQDSLVFNTAYNASSNKVATMSDVSGKQDALVFNTAYNATTNKVATMADIPSGSSFDPSTDLPLGPGLVFGLANPEDSEDSLYVDIGSFDVEVSQIITGSKEDLTDPENPGVVPVYLPETLSDMDTAIAGKQDALVFNTAYNASSNKVATMSDITTALGGISAFSFEIVQSLPQSNISTSKIYLVAKQTSGTNQVYTEYAYVNNGWEIIGDTSMTIDTLSNSEVQTIWSAASAT